MVEANAAWMDRRGGSLAAGATGRDAVTFVLATNLAPFAVEELHAARPVMGFVGAIHGIRVKPLERNCCC